MKPDGTDFPSFSEGLSLRPKTLNARRAVGGKFPFLFGGTFIEASSAQPTPEPEPNFPSFSEGLSLRRRVEVLAAIELATISLPFRRDFH